MRAQPAVRMPFRTPPAVKIPLTVLIPKIMDLGLQLQMYFGVDVVASAKFTHQRTWTIPNKKYWVDARWDTSSKKWVVNKDLKFAGVKSSTSNSVEGEISAKLRVEPVVTALLTVFGAKLSGPYVQLGPYLRLAYTAKTLTMQLCRNVYVGLQASVGWRLDLLVKELSGFLSAKAWDQKLGSVETAIVKAKCSCILGTVPCLDQCVKPPACEPNKTKPCGGSGKFGIATCTTGCKWSTCKITGECTMSSHCDDANPCTKDSCKGGKCVGTAAANGTSCGANKHCSVGKCVVKAQCGSAAQCDDGNPCTKDSCSGGKCAHGAVANGSSCGGGKTCQSGACKSPPPSCAGKNCDDANPCTNDSCNAGTCSHSAKANGTGCGGSNTCQAGVCKAPSPACAGKNCDDGNVCTDDSCAAGKCVHNAKSSGTCGSGKTCQSGKCVAQPKPPKGCTVVDDFGTNFGAVCQATGKSHWWKLSGGGLTNAEGGSCHYTYTNGSKLDCHARWSFPALETGTYSFWVRVPKPAKSALKASGVVQNSIRYNIYPQGQATGKPKVLSNPVDQSWDQNDPDKTGGWKLIRQGVSVVKSSDAGKPVSVTLGDNYFKYKQYMILWDAMRACPK